MSLTSPRAGMRRASRPPRATLLGVLAAGTAMLGALLAAAPAAAATASGPEGQQVTVTPSSGLDPDGQTVTVSGSGFDAAKGVYVALCVDNGAGRQPGPCLGGVDMEGAGGASAWISSNPPAYGEGLAVPFTESGGRGSFSVTLAVAASDSFTGCLDPPVAPNGCVIGTRADHTRAGDRSADVRIPVTFASGGGGTDSGPGSESQDAVGASGDDAAADDGSLASTGATVGIAAGTAALLVLAGLLAVRLRRRHSA